MNSTLPLAVQFDGIVKKWNRTLRSTIDKTATFVSDPSKEGVAVGIHQVEDALFRLRLWAGDIATKHGDGGPVSTLATLEMLEATGSDMVPVLRGILNRMDHIASDFESKHDPLSDKFISDEAEELSRAVDDLDMHRDKIREKVSKFGGKYKSNKPLAVLCFGRVCADSPTQNTMPYLKTDQQNRRWRIAQLCESARAARTDGRAFPSLFENPHMYVSGLPRILVPCLFQC